MVQLIENIAMHCFTVETLSLRKFTRNIQLTSLFCTKTACEVQFFELGKLKGLFCICSIFLFYSFTTALNNDQMVFLTELIQTDFRKVSALVVLMQYFENQSGYHFIVKCILFRK